MYKALFIFSLLAFSSVAQKVHFKHFSEEKLKYDYVFHRLDYNNCKEDSALFSPILIKIHSVSPDEADEQKAYRIIELDTIIWNLSKYSDCKSTETIIIQLGEALFLKEADGFELYSKTYNKKGNKLNAERFWERYKIFFQKNLPGKTIVLVDWIW